MGRERLKVWGGITLLWACALFPNLGRRSFIWEEGSNAEIARNILERGDVLHPLLHGAVWIEKPPLPSALIAAVSWVAGGVSEWTARLPSMLAVLLTVFMVQALTRRYASLQASLFAAGAFMFCPLLLQKLTIAEPDTLVTALSFAAFIVWWNGAERGGPGLLRWLGCGVVLAALAMVKGPQPVGFFALGVGAFLVLTRRWRDLVGLVVCLLVPLAATAAWGMAVYSKDLDLNRTWLQYLRVYRHPSLGEYAWRNGRTVVQLALELLPGLLLLPFLPRPWRSDELAAAPKVVLPLVCYATACTAILLVWPYALSRYAMPIAPAVAVLAGIAFDRVAATRFARLRDIAAIIVIALAVYQLVLTIVIVPLFAEKFSTARRDGQRLGEMVRTVDLPVYCQQEANNNQLFYSGIKIVNCTKNTDLLKFKPPAWLLAQQEDLDYLATYRHDLDIENKLRTTAAGPEVIAAIVRSKAAPAETR